MMGPHRGWGRGHSYFLNSLCSAGLICFWFQPLFSGSFVCASLNRICAMVADIRPAAGAAVSLEDFFGG